FSGSLTDTAAFDSNGVFQGDNVSQSVDVGGSVPTQVSASGAMAFTAAGGRDVFADLEALATALGADNRAGAAAALDNLDQNQRQITNERSRVGLISNKLESSGSLLDQLDLDLNKRQTGVGAIDPFEAYSKVTSLGQSLERAVTVSRQLMDSANAWQR
ncbi:MAG TPA: flagellin, partial [Polyangiales bacterium]|nr:flagellin [Polyangiales bacterium]